MLEILLVRHGETEQNRLSIIQGQQPGDLSPLGLSQSKLLAKHLTDLAIDYCYCSDLKRTVDTLSFFTEVTPLTVEYSNLIRERAFGDIEGAEGKVYLNLLKSSGLTRVDYRPPMGENFHDLKNRTDQFLNNIYNKHHSGRILVMTHGGTIRTLIAGLINMPLNELIRSEIRNCSISSFTLDASKEVIEYQINFCKHLDVLGDANPDSLGIDVLIKQAEETENA